MRDLSSESVRLVERLKAGDRRALAELFQRHRDRLRRIVELRMDAEIGSYQDDFDPTREDPAFAQTEEREPSL